MEFHDFNEEMEEFFFKSSLSSYFHKDNYEILFSSTTDGEGKGVCEINGAEISPDYQLKYKIHWHSSKKEKIDSIEFTMPNDEAKIGQIFSTMPYGLINKNRTGLGATTLELSSRRNSIVVVPTRALAYEKAKNSRIDNTDKYKVLYYGGRIPGFTVPSVSEYLQDNEIPFKKFIVVIDSLPRLLEEIPETEQNNYFIMFDEIDSYQYDSHYRVNMESAFDYYFKYPPNKRCLVSATIGKFSNPLINQEPVINIKFNSTSQRNITLQHTDNVIITTARLIEETYRLHPGEKILIALNWVTEGIMYIIESLPQELKEKCSVLCGDKNREDVGQYYKEILNTTLPSEITFMTCTYFVGIDINERFHLISCCEVKRVFTLFIIPNNTPTDSQLVGVFLL